MAMQLDGSEDISLVFLGGFFFGNFSIPLLNKSILKNQVSSMISIIMSSHFLRLMHHQKRFTQMEEDKLSSESEDVYSPPSVTSRRPFERTELVIRIFCGLIFVAGALMLSAAGYVKQSDRVCAAQLSMWCRYKVKFLRCCAQC